MRLEDSSDDRGGEEAEAQEGEGETGEEEGSTGGTFGFSVESSKGKLTFFITFVFQKKNLNNHSAVNSWFVFVFEGNHSKNI